MPANLSADVAAVFASAQSAAVRPQSFSHPAVFRIGDTASAAKKPALKTGFALLDGVLPDGGWSRGELCELLCDDVGIGELGLLLPTMRLAERGHCLWIAPPHLPHAPALAAAGLSLKNLTIVDSPRAEDSLWAAEQALTSAAADMVCVWANSAMSDTSLRRLKHAASLGGAMCWLMRPRMFAAHASPASLRIALGGCADGRLALNLIKRRGLPPNKQISLMTRTLPCLLRAQSLATHDASRASQVNAESTPRGALHRWLEETFGHVVSGAVANTAASPSMLPAIRERRMSPDR
jgi:protein ImuA